jgi:fructose/tagatose bisphosphate aldolase
MERVMVVYTSAKEMNEKLSGIVRLNADRTLTVTDPTRFRNEVVDGLVETAVFAEDEQVRNVARWLIWECGHALGVHSASIQKLYEARGRGKCSGFTVPAVNIRSLTYESARAMFRAAHSIEAGPVVFELARSEMGYTFQRPAEYTACVLAAAIKENHHGPVFIQGDHFQFNPKKYADNASAETESIRHLISEAIEAGFYNIDIDSSTLVDLSFPSLDEQQRVNYERAAEMTAWIRKHEPQEVAISVGGEIGEVGHKNSTVDELRAYMNGYLATLGKLGTDLKPISKVSVQTGTSHGGVPTASGEVAEVKLDFQVLEDMSRVALEEYAMAGAVQHGASTLPDELFDRFPATETAEIHLATGFQNLLFDGGFLPDELRQRMLDWPRENCADERKEGETDEQFLYKTRKKSYGPFKRELWELPEDVRNKYCEAMEKKLAYLFDKLGMKETADLQEQFIHPALVHWPQPEGVEQVLGQTAPAG